jgi:hypothetical protein
MRFVRKLPSVSFAEVWHSLKCKFTLWKHFQVERSLKCTFAEVDFLVAFAKTNAFFFLFLRHFRDRRSMRQRRQQQVRSAAPIRASGAALRNARAAAARERKKVAASRLPEEEGKDLELEADPLLLPTASTAAVTEPLLGSSIERCAYY